MSKLKSCHDCGHKVSRSARSIKPSGSQTATSSASCPNCGRTNPGEEAIDFIQTINAFLWRFFGVLFLLFILYNMIIDYRVSSRNELGGRLDELQLEMEQSSERMRRAVEENN